MKVYEAITQAIQQEGAEIIFGVMGDANQNMLVRLADQLGVRFIPARHEQSAVSMADGYARASGKLGLASVTQGPGLTNTATSLVAANRHGSPLLLLACDVSLRDPYEDAIRTLAEQLDAPVATTLPAKGICAESTSVHGAHGPRPVCLSTDSSTIRRRSWNTTRNSRRKIRS